jgi:lipopolysaccharide transport system permease protein
LSKVKQTTEDINEWTTVITPPAGLLNFNPGDIWKYRGLILLFLRRDFTVYYKQTILGPLWFLIQPLLTTLVFTVIFGMVAKLPTDGVPFMLFYLSGTVMWNYFSSCMINISNIFFYNSNVFSKVYFPRLVVPMASVLFYLVTFGIHLLLLVIFRIYYHFNGFEAVFSSYLFLIPLLLIQMAMLGIGTGLIVASLTTKYRDFMFLVNFGIQLWMYATPVVYPYSLLPENLKTISVLNPMTMIVEAFRVGILNAGHFDWMHYMVSWVITLVLFMFGVLLFSRIEKTFIDRI